MYRKGSVYVPLRLVIRSVEIMKMPRGRVIASFALKIRTLAPLISVMTRSLYCLPPTQKEQENPSATQKSILYAVSASHLEPLISSVYWGAMTLQVRGKCGFSLRFHNEDMSSTLNRAQSYIWYWTYFPISARNRRQMVNSENVNGTVRLFCQYGHEYWSLWGHLRRQPRLLRKLG